MIISFIFINPNDKGDFLKRLEDLKTPSCVKRTIKKYYLKANKKERICLGNLLSWLEESYEFCTKLWTDGIPEGFQEYEKKVIKDIMYYLE